jgi:hypothetical protein
MPGSGRRGKLAVRRRYEWSANDETGWRLKGDQRTLWGAVTSVAAVFRIAPDRHEREATWPLGDDFEGVVGSDRWWAYRGFAPARRQLCWSHLIRDLTAHAEGLAAQKEFGERGPDIARRLSAPGSSSSKTETADG